MGWVQLAPFHVAGLLCCSSIVTTVAVKRSSCLQLDHQTSKLSIPNSRRLHWFAIGSDGCSAFQWGTLCQILLNTCVQKILLQLQRCFSPDSQPQLSIARALHSIGAYVKHSNKIFSWRHLSIETQFLAMSKDLCNLFVLSGRSFAHDCTSLGQPFPVLCQRCPFLK